MSNIIKLSRQGDDGLNEIDLDIWPNHISAIITTADFCKFKGAVIAKGVYSKRRCINRGVMAGFRTEIAHWPHSKKRVSLDKIYQHVEFWCDDTIRDLFNANCQINNSILIK